MATEERIKIREAKGYIGTISERLAALRQKPPRGGNPARLRRSRAEAPN